MMRELVPTFTQTYDSGKGLTPPAPFVCALANRTRAVVSPDLSANAVRVVDPETGVRIIRFLRSCTYVYVHKRVIDNNDNDGRHDLTKSYRH